MNLLNEPDNMLSLVHATQIRLRVRRGQKILLLDYDLTD